MTPEEQARDFAKRCGWEQGEAGSTEKGWRRVHEDDLTKAFLAHRAEVIEEVARAFDASSAAYEGNGKADRASLDLYFNLARQERAAAAAVRALAAK